MVKEKKKEIEKENNSEPDEDQSKIRKKKKMSKKTIIIIAIFVIIIVLIVGLWGTQSDGTDYPTVSMIIDDQEKYLDEEVEFRGTVKKDSLDFKNMTFTLTDDENDLPIDYSTILLPSNFEEGKDVVVKGILRNQGSLLVEAAEITVGCASKY